MAKIPPVPSTTPLPPKPGAPGNAHPNSPWRIGDRVTHTEYGEGTVIYPGNFMSRVEFDRLGDTRMVMTDYLTTVDGKAPVRPVTANDNVPVAISASSWSLPDPKAIPPREWLYGHHYIRKFVSVTVSPGGVGKTSLGMGEALSMATGRELFGVKVHQRVRVWIWNGEDPQEELDRRLTAACLHYGIRASEIDGMLFVDSGRNMPLITARQTKDGAQIAVPVVDRLCEEIKAKGIDVMIIDPFVSSHAISENDNMAMDAVVKQTWATIADRTNCSVDLVHHAKKMGGQEVTAESARGGVALIGAARAARVLNPMTQEEANKANVENKRLHFRVGDAKSNLAPPSDKSSWYRMVSFDLGNATNERPSDNVGVATTWTWPSATEGLTAKDLLAVQKVVNAGSYKDSVQAGNWVGQAVAEALGLDAQDDKDRIKELLKVWKSTNALRVEQKEDANRKLTPHIVVGEWAHNP
ncbi:AAA family ATPase [Agrobacterium tumefaciens]|uniref:AAA family ATPase n=1 Tax=Agrobacterium tumefaciens TaxID=358 RepID=UPI003B9FF1D8